MAIAVGLVALASLPTGSAAAPTFPSAGFAWRLAGSHGYRLTIGAAAERPDGRGYVAVTVRRPGSSAFATYLARGMVTASSIEADFGAFGRVDVAVVPSGPERDVTFRNCGQYTERFQPGEVEGEIEFHGERSFTTVSVGHASLVAVGSTFNYCGTGFGESFSTTLPGARLKGVSFAGGRILVFQVNKNRPKSRVIYSASLKERRHGVRIYRELTGSAGPASFRFHRRLRSAVLEPPAPFAGVAVARRDPDTVSPLWRGDLTLDFLGLPAFPIAGAAVHVSLNHARREPGEHGSASIEFP